MEKDVEEAGMFPQDKLPPKDAFIERRATLAQLYQALPIYGSASFWQVIERHQINASPLPLEILVMVLREAVAREDGPAQRRVFEVLIARLQASNEQWIGQTLNNCGIPPGEYHTLTADLYADLCEILLRALRDPQQTFWEENFWHRLRFARKHAYEGLLRREGRWVKQTPGPGARVPHMLLESLEEIDWDVEIEEKALWVFDERAEKAFEAVELEDLASLVLHLPTSQRAVVWLIFWEDCSVKMVSKLLDISSRTVRNRLQAALTHLRSVLEAEEKVMNPGLESQGLQVACPSFGSDLSSLT